MKAHLIPGLVSVSFRKWTPEVIVREVVSSGLRAIEWGGDVHVPHGNLSVAKSVGAATRDAGLSVAAYGSYYRLAASESQGLSWQAVLDTARALGAPMIRVWAGMLGSSDPRADEAHWAAVAADAARIAAEAEAAGVRVCFEYHGGVLTDGLAATRRLLHRAGHPGLLVNWQPQHHLVTTVGLEELRAFSGRLANLHVFSWIGGGWDKRPLATLEDRWLLYLREALKAPLVSESGGGTHPRHALLEFLPFETPEDLRRDAVTLVRLLKEAGREG